MADSERPTRPLVPAERRRLILERLREQGSVATATLEEDFGISPMTARRDLSILADSGFARRTHGGAVLPELAAHEDSFHRRLNQQVEAKTALAEAVAKTVASEETLFIDSSTTAYFVVREILAADLRVTLLTNSQPVMTLVGASESPLVELIGLGGRYRKLTSSFVGTETLESISGYFADRVIFSVKAIESSGYLTDPDPDEAAVKRAMILRSRHATVVSEATKFDGHGLNVIVAAAELDTAYVEPGPAAGIETLRAAGVDVREVRPLGTSGRTASSGE
ncbi:MAG: DeoR/GlpR family DNA-binding transcription regulator [Conexibacteraceae bacterium]|nr:DeoR/GlpR family DNA-binding transcription regulator [Conexibacteraceae bacterium]